MRNYRAIIKQLPLFRERFIRTEKMKGGLTNTNFKISVGKEIYVARFAPKNESALGISKKSEFRNCAIAERLGIGPKPVGFYVGHSLLLVEYIHGKVSNKTLIKKKSSIIKLARLLKTIHEGPRFKNYVDLFDQARQYFATAKKLGAWMPRNSTYLISSIDTLEKKLKKKSWIKQSHLDLMIANVIHTRRGLKLIDWEYAGNADCRYDLAMISFKANFNLAQDKLLLKHYGSPTLTLRQLELMKCIVALREGSWGLVQIKLSKIKHDYKKHATSHFARFSEMTKELSL